MKRRQKTRIELVEVVCPICKTKYLRYNYGTKYKRRYRWTSREYGKIWVFGRPHASLNDPCPYCGRQVRKDTFIF